MNDDRKSLVQKSNLNWSCQIRIKGWFTVSFYLKQLNCFCRHTVTAYQIPLNRLRMLRLLEALNSFRSFKSHVPFVFPAYLAKFSLRLIKKKKKYNVKLFMWRNRSPIYVCYYSFSLTSLTKHLMTGTNS